MALINSPPNSPVDVAVAEGRSLRLVNVTEGWRNFFMSTFTICSALTMSGTTAQRPTRPLWVGRMYFDTTLGLPIWVRSLSPTVWVNAAGGVV